MLLPDKPIDDRYLTQDDRIAIAEGLLAGRTAAAMAEEIGKHRSTVYREISRGRGDPRGPTTRGGPTIRPSCGGFAPSRRSSAPTQSCGPSSTTS